MIKKLIMTNALILLSFSVNAELLNDQKLKKVHVNGNGGYYLQTQSPMNDNEECGSNGWYKLDSNKTFVKEMFTVALSAYMAEKNVQLSLSGCNGGYPAVEWINVSG